jgi:hypothetical protein
MAYNEELDARISQAVSGWGAKRMKMFGGTAYLINGNMMCGVNKDNLILRLSEAQAEEALAQPHVRLFDLTGRPMKGWVQVAGAGFEGPALDEWLQKARQHAESLPPK